MTELSTKRLREFFHRRRIEPLKGEKVDHRANIRYRTYAKVNFPGIMEQESILKDISITGCRIECTSLANIQLDTGYILEIIPEADSRIGRFELEVKAVWISPAGYAGDVGFIITASPRGKSFQRYVDYLSWRGNQQ